MVNINDAYSTYLKAEDLQGLPMLATIKEVGVRTFDGGEKKGEIFFHECERGVLLNVTNKNVLVEMFGPETDYWIGQQVEVFPSTTDYQGKVVACIRLRAPVRQVNPAQPHVAIGQTPQPAPVNVRQQQPGPAQQGQPQQHTEANPPPHPGTNPLAGG